MPHIIRRSDLVWRSWKNGGGVMADIAVTPKGADFDLTDWRVSIAKVEHDGSFSSFAGMDRGMVLLAGQRLELHIDDTPLLLVDADGPAVSFPGDRPTRGVPIGGPVENLNVMTRRGHMQHRISRHAVAGRHSVHAANGSTTVLYVARGSVEASGNPALRLGAGDVLVTDGAQTLVSSSAQLIEINLWPV